MTEQKYQGSYEYLASLVKRYSSVSGLDLTIFWEQVIFSWIVGNADMHMKNFSLIRDEKGKYRLSPAYDQVSTALVMPEDTEEFALPLQGFKIKLMSFDFIYAMTDSGLDASVAEKLLFKFHKYKERWFDCIDASFITENQKEQFKKFIETRLDTLLK